jgi:hypothetical protein
MRESSTCLHPRTVARRTAAALALLALVTVGLSATDARADRVERRNGPDVEGDVLTLDEGQVKIRTPEGTVSIPRDQVRAIVFDELAAPPPPLKVEIRNVRSDDFLDVLLDDEPIIQRAREGGRWIDVTDKLKDGNNPLRLRIHNERRVWGYHFTVRINGTVTKLECGTPAAGRGCQCCGKTGFETGTIEDLPVVWIHVDRALGIAEVLP